MGLRRESRGFSLDIDKRHLRTVLRRLNSSMASRVRRIRDWYYDDFKREYKHRGPVGISSTKWCCIYTDAFGGEHRFTITALSRVDATASCLAQVPSDSSFRVYSGRC